jgi:hypothetical protein
MDFFLKFPDEAAALAALFDPETVGEQTLQKPKFRNVDVIGTIYRPTGTHSDVNGMIVPDMAALDGFHANVRLVEGEEAQALEALRVYPANPARVWA